MTVYYRLNETKCYIYNIWWKKGLIRQNNSDSLQIMNILEVCASKKG